jgi:hypothetical protein
VPTRGVIQSPVLAGRDTHLVLSLGSTELDFAPFCNPYQ